MLQMRGIPDMKYPKDQLLEKLKSNRDKHAADFKVAMKEYRQATAAACRQVLDMLDSGKDVNHAHVLKNLSRPVDQTRHYDRMLEMLSLTSDTQIELSQEVFTQIVLDDWDWKSGYEATKLSNSSYLG